MLGKPKPGASIVALKLRMAAAMVKAPVFCSPASSITYAGYGNRAGYGPRSIRIQTFNRKYPGSGSKMLMKRGTVTVEASAGGGGPNRIHASQTLDKSIKAQPMEGGAVIQDSIYSDHTDSDTSVWEQMRVLVRLGCSIGIYGVMVLMGKAICYFTGMDSLGGLNLCPQAVINGFGYAIPPVMGLLFILDDGAVMHSPHAKAIRDVEDEELMNFFVGMSPWQFLLLVTASSVGEELFFRVAVQGGLAHAFLSNTALNKETYGLAALMGIFPIFVPFAQTFAAVITAALTGSFYYVADSTQDPIFVVTPSARSHHAHQDIKKCFAAWYERRQLQKIYSPLLESILALYLGFEWIQTGNILSTMITHTIYSAIVLGNGLWRIRDQKHKLYQRSRKAGKNKDIRSTSEF